MITHSRQNYSGWGVVANTNGFGPKAIPKFVNNFTQIEGALENGNANPRLSITVSNLHMSTFHCNPNKTKIFPIIFHTQRPEIVAGPTFAPQNRYAGRFIRSISSEGP
jgi:hypothetical protein